MYKLDLEKAEEPETKSPTYIGSQKREFQKNIYICFIDYAEAFFHCVDHKKLRKILKEMGILDHLTSILRNIYAGQEATVRTWHGTMDWFKFGKGVCQGCILSPCLLNLYVDYVVYGWSTNCNQDCLENINNLRYADDIPLMAKSEEELKSLMMKVNKESDKLV